MTSPPTRTALSFYFATGRSVKYCDECLYVRVYVCPLAYLKNTSKFHEIFCTCYLWPWLGHPQMTMQYVMYFWFCG